MHWLHSASQIVNQIGGNCHTVDEFARVLFELLEDRQFAIASSFSESKRSQGKSLLANETLADNSETEINKVQSEADLIETRARSYIAQPALDAARVEVSILHELLERVIPLCAFPANPIGFQKVQYYETTFELLWRYYLERKYGAHTMETISRMEKTGSLQIVFDDHLKDVEIRHAGDFYELLSRVSTHMGWPEFSFMCPDYLMSLQDTVNTHLDNSVDMQNYLLSFANTYSKGALSGFVMQLNAPVKNSEENPKWKTGLKQHQSKRN